MQLACSAIAGVDMFITNDQYLSRHVVSGIHFIQSLGGAKLEQRAAWSRLGRLATDNCIDATEGYLSESRDLPRR